MEEKKQGNLADSLSGGQKYVPSLNTKAVEGLDFNKLKTKLDDFKKMMLKKFPFTIALGIIPTNANRLFEEDEGMPKEEIEKNPIHILMIMPEDQYKNLNKIKPEVIKLASESGEKLWVHIKTAEVDVWNYGLDGKYEFIDAISACFPLHDTGILGAIRVANIHKTLVLNWLNVGRVRYVATYAIAGSLVRGTADKTSDVDTFVIIDDTDVKRMSRVELLDKLRGKIMNDFAKEATALAGVTNILNIQVYLLTDFWQAVKDAHPVMFTFIRDGVPLYDKGTFTPWKRLLQMGKIKPSPEAIDLYMKEGDRTDDILKRRNLDNMVDIYWGIVTPTHAMMMLAGQGPPVPKVLVQEVKKILVDKEKVMNMKDLKTLEKIIKLYKDYEHGTLKSISGKELDDLYIEGKNYAKKMKEVRGILEKRSHERQADSIDEVAFNLMKKIFGSKAKDQLLKDLEKDLIKKGKIPERMLDIAKDVSNLKSKTKTKKLSQSEMQRYSRDASELVNALTEYSQRKELVSMEKGIMQVSAKGMKVEIVATDDGFYVVDQTGRISVIHKKNLVKKDKKDLDKAISGTKDRLRFELPSEVLDAVKKEYGEFSVSF